MYLYRCHPYDIPAPVQLRDYQGRREPVICHGKVSENRAMKWRFISSVFLRAAGCDLECTGMFGSSTAGHLFVWVPMNANKCRAIKIAEVIGRALMNAL